MICTRILGRTELPLRFAAVTMFVIGCSATAAEPTVDPPQNGGQGGSISMMVAGTTSASGAPTFGGVPGSSGGSNLSAGGPGSGGSSSAGSAGKPGGGGGTTSSGGALGFAGAVPLAGGSTSVTAGAPATGSGGAAPASGCDAAKGELTKAVIYDGSNQIACTNALTSPRVGYWFTYNDETTTAMQLPAANASGAIAGEKMGKGGADDCAMHTSGEGFSKWGAGVGFSLHQSGATLCAFDASVFTGVKFYAKGTATGTRGEGYLAAPNTIRVRFKMSAVSLGDDDFGAWCTLTPDWTQCTVPFAMLKQEGFGKAGTFNPKAIEQIMFQAAKEGELPETSVDFDFWIDDVTFY